LKPQPSIEPPRLPALVFLDGQTGALRVAALTLLDRLVVAAHRAGAGPIAIVAREPLPALERAAALGIEVRVIPTPPAAGGPALVTGTGLLVQAADVRALIERGGRLTTAAGDPLPIGVVSQAGPNWQASLDGRPEVAAQGLALRVTDATSARAATRAFWASLTSSADGFVDRFFNRPCGRVLSRLLIHTSISPNAVSLASVAIGLAAAGCFGMGSYSSAVVAALLFQLSAIVDCVDGDLARALFKETPLGKWLDLAGDQIVHLSVFAGIAVGLARQGQSPVAAWLGLAAVLGALLSFGVVVRGMRLPPKDRTRFTRRLIDSVTNRDFSVLVLALACLDRLEWFLWLSAAGSHVFWVAALALQPALRPRRKLA